MLLLLLLVTPLVNAVHDSWPSPRTCTLPQPLKTVDSTKNLIGTWFGLYSSAKQTCYSETYIDTGDNTMNMSTTDIMENGCGQTSYGTNKLGPNNILAYTYSCKPIWSGDYVILATDCKTYFIFGYCKPGSCKPGYFIEFSCPNPSNCTMKKVEKDLTCLGLDWTIFNQNC